MVAAVQTYWRAMDGMQGRRTMLEWGAPVELPVTQSFPGHVVRFLLKHFKYPSLL